MKTILTIFIIIIHSNYFSQVDLNVKKKAYGLEDLPYFLRTDSTARCSPLGFRFGYTYQIPNGFFRIGGTSVELDVNLARLFTTKIILGIGFEYKQFLFKGRQKLDQNFIDDFNNNYMPNNSNLYDSIASATLAGSINDESGYKIFGSNFSSICFNFSPFPDRYGGFLLQYKIGRSLFPLSGPLSQFLSDAEKPPLIVETIKDQTLEISFHPYKFFDNSRVRLSSFKIKDWYKSLILAGYCKKTSLNNANFGGEPLSAFVNSGFISNYSTVYSFGIKIGIGIW